MRTVRCSGRLLRGCLPRGCLPRRGGSAFSLGGCGSLHPLWTDRHLWKHGLSATAVADGNKGRARYRGARNISRVWDAWNRSKSSFFQDVALCTKSTCVARFNCRRKVFSWFQHNRAITTFDRKLHPLKSGQLTGPSLNTLFTKTTTNCETMEAIRYR